MTRLGLFSDALRLARRRSAGGDEAFAPGDAVPMRVRYPLGRSQGALGVVACGHKVPDWAHWNRGLPMKISAQNRFHPLSSRSTGLGLGLGMCLALSACLGVSDRGIALGEQPGQGHDEDATQGELLDPTSEQSEGGAGSTGEGSAPSMSDDQQESSSGSTGSSAESPNSSDDSGEESSSQGSSTGDPGDSTSTTGDSSSNSSSSTPDSGTSDSFSSSTSDSTSDFGSSDSSSSSSGETTTEEPEPEPERDCDDINWGVGQVVERGTAQGYVDRNGDDRVEVAQVDAGMCELYKSGRKCGLVLFGFHG